jgi:hypothetical protein
MWSGLVDGQHRAQSGYHQCVIPGFEPRRHGTGSYHHHRRKPAGHAWLQLTRGYTSCGAGHTFKPRIPQTSLWCSGRVVCRVHHSLERGTVPDFDGPQPFCSIPEANYFFALFFSCILSSTSPSLGVILVILIVIHSPQVVVMIQSTVLHRYMPRQNQIAMSRLRIRI